jgi:hypothetical protein
MADGIRVASYQSPASSHMWDESELVVIECCHGKADISGLQRNHTG